MNIPKTDEMKQMFEAINIAISNLQEIMNAEIALISRYEINAIEEILEHKNNCISFIDINMPKIKQYIETFDEASQNTWRLKVRGLYDTAHKNAASIQKLKVYKEVVLKCIAKAINSTTANDLFYDNNGKANTPKMPAKIASAGFIKKMR